MLRFFLPVCAITTLLGGCFGQNIPSGQIEGRLLQPPREGIKVGSLYYVREKPTNSFKKGAYLESLCYINLDKYGIVPEGPFSTADIDFSRQLELSGAISGLNARIADVGLDGKFSDYFEYKLTNAKRVDITGVDAEKLFRSRAFQDDCLGWRNNISKNGWAAYQILSVTYGDISFGPKTTASLSPTVSLKLASITPSIKSTISSTTQTKTSGKGLVVSFTPIIRN